MWTLLAIGIAILLIVILVVLLLRGRRQSAGAAEVLTRLPPISIDAEGIFYIDSDSALERERLRKLFEEYEREYS